MKVAWPSHLQVITQPHSCNSNHASKLLLKKEEHGCYFVCFKSTSAKALQFAESFPTPV